MIKAEIARRLLAGVYYPVSAVAAADSSGHVMDVALFDTEFGDLPALSCANPDEIWLFTNHPEGRKQLYEKDGHHISGLRMQYPSVRLRVMITNEDFICREYALFLPDEV